MAAAAVQRPGVQGQEVPGGRADPGLPGLLLHLVRHPQGLRAAQAADAAGQGRAVHPGLAAHPAAGQPPGRGLHRHPGQDQRGRLDHPRRPADGDGQLPRRPVRGPLGDRRLLGRRPLRGQAVAGPPQPLPGRHRDVRLQRPGGRARLAGRQGREAARGQQPGQHPQVRPAAAEGRPARQRRQGRRLRGRSGDRRRGQGADQGPGRGEHRPAHHRHVEADGPERLRVADRDHPGAVTGRHDRPAATTDRWSDRPAVGPVGTAEGPPRAFAAGPRPFSVLPATSQEPIGHDQDRPGPDRDCQKAASPPIRPTIRPATGPPIGPPVRPVPAPGRSPPGPPAGKGPARSAPRSGRSGSAGC